MNKEFKPCIIIPCYNHGSLLLENLGNITKHGIPIIVVDDASEGEELLQQGLASLKNVSLIQHKQNLGKGGALLTGFNEAQKQGYTHALQVDADGQHDYEDIPLFLAEAKEHSDKVILGTPIFDDSAPLERIWGRKISTFFVALETLSFSAHDVLFGFRVYPLKSTCAIISKRSVNYRMGFDVQIIVYHIWEGIGVRNVLSKVTYSNHMHSNFRYLEDNFSFVLVHIWLIALGVSFVPVGFARRVLFK